MSHSGVLCWDHLHRYQCQQPAASSSPAPVHTSNQFCGEMVWACCRAPAQHTAAQHQETLRHCHESGPRNVLHLIPALDCPQCPLVEWSRSEHRPGANVGVNAMPRTPQHTSCCGAVDELGAAAPQHHSTTAPPHHSHNCVLSSRTGEAVVACVRQQRRGGQVSWVQ